MIALQKLWKVFLVSSQKLFSFWSYLNFCNFFSSFPHFPDTNGKWNNLSWIGLHKFTDAVFEITQQPLYITSSNLVKYNEGIFLSLFCSLKSKWSLVPGPFCFLYLCPLKRAGFGRKSKVDFLKGFCDNPLSKYLTIKRGSGTSFWCTFSAWFFHKNVFYLILYQRTKFQCHTFFPSQDIKQNVLSSYLDSWWCHKL